MVNLAYPVEQTTSAKFGSLVDFIEHFAYDGPVARAIVAGIVVIGAAQVFLWAHRFMKRAEPRGTAQVLSFVNLAGNKNCRQRHGRQVDGRDLCRIELEVNIPGREPYVTVVEEPLWPSGQAELQPGKAVRVRVDTDNPKSLRFDFNQPAQPRQASSR
jgi:hypothetical protein